MNVVIANIINFIASIFSIFSTSQKKKKQIVAFEALSSFLRIVQCILVFGWTELIAKVIKLLAQISTLRGIYNKRTFYIVSMLYLITSIIIVYYTQNLKLIVAIIPSILELYALLKKSVKKYRSYIIITKVLWTINNIIFKLYVGIIFDALVILGHTLNLKSKKSK